MTYNVKITRVIMCNKVCRLDVPVEIYKMRIMENNSKRTVTTMAEIARLAGVSRTAVSAVLNNKRGTIRLNDRTRRKIEAVLKKTHYRANTVGRALAMGRSLVIGVVVSEINMSFFSQSLQAIEDFTEKRNYGVLLMTSRNKPGRKEQVVEFMLERRVDGIIYADWTEINEKVRQLLIRDNIPVAYLFQYPENPIPRSGYVCSDADQVGYLAGRHLFEVGHRHIACVSIMKLIHDGVIRAAREIPGRKKIEQWAYESGEAIFHRWLSSDPRATAMFLYGDEFACQILNLAVRRGVKIPQELALVGIDDIPLASQAVIPLTTIQQPKYEQGWAAAEVLFEMIEGQPGRAVVFPTSLVRRQTT